MFPAAGSAMVCKAYYLCSFFLSLVIHPLSFSFLYRSSSSPIDFVFVDANRYPTSSSSSSSSETCATRTPYSNQMLWAESKLAAMIPPLQPAFNSWDSERPMQSQTIWILSKLDLRASKRNPTKKIQISCLSAFN